MPPDPRADTAKFVRVVRTVCDETRQHIEHTSQLLQCSEKLARRSQRRLSLSMDLLARARSAWPWEHEPAVRRRHWVPSV
jgi:hypothetical protein